MKEQQFEYLILAHLLSNQAKQLSPKINMDKVAVNWEQLPPLLRILLVTDGTVTKTLEAYYWERISVDQLAQALHGIILTLQRDQHAISCRQGVNGQ